MSSPRPAKRTRQRQACEPCRRKKTRCPGERPTCSFCARLRQRCAYADEVLHSTDVTPVSNRDQACASRDSQRLEDRVQVLEAKLAEVVGVASQQQTRERSASHSLPDPSRNIACFLTMPGLGITQLDSTLPPWNIVTMAVEKYLLFSDCQPLALFHRGSLIATLRSRDPEVLFAIMALSLRFFEDPTVLDSLNELTNSYAEAARTMVMRRISAGPVELSTLQSLCLLSLVDFTNGNKHRASVHSSLAMNLANCAGLTSESHMNLSEVMCEERRRCFWSILLLKRLHGADISDLDFSGEETFPWYPMSTGLCSAELSDADRPPSSASNNELLRNDTKDAGIVAYAIQLSEVWFKTTKYARRRGKPSKLAPWSPKSEYAMIVAQQMEFETRMPYIHRFKPAGFSKRSTDELQVNRNYWGPWLFIQFLYHTNLCLLNHPLILALRLRNFRSVIPEIFLQNTSDLISSHTSWIIHLINILQEKAFKVTDPFLGHCAAIVATIHLQESFVEDSDVRAEKQIHFAKCLQFIRGIGEQWPHIARMADKLHALQNTVSASYHHRSSNSQTPTRSLLIDLARFWEILDYSSASELYESAGQLFGPSLYFGPHPPAAEVSNTSTLPPPTRLGSASTYTNQDTEMEALRTGQHLGLRFGDSFSRPSLPLSTLAYGGFTEPVYSNDELAILADSFFNQRQEYVGDTDDWWNTGNL